MATEQKRVSADNSALLDAINALQKKILEAIAATSQTHSNDLHEVKTTIDQVLGVVHEQNTKAPRARAGRSEASTSGHAAATGKTARFPQTAKAWFIKSYTDDETVRAKYVSMLDAIHAQTAYANAAPEDKLKKEATIIYENLKKRADKKDVNAIDDEFRNKQEEHKKALGHITTSAPAASSSAAPAAKSDPAVAVKPKKPRAPAKPRAAKKVGNAQPTLVESATEEKDGEDSASEAEGKDTE